MKRYLRIDPFHYPLIIILAFVVGFILAIALGFRPVHGSQDGHSEAVLPAIVQVLPGSEFSL